jgi:tetratricopeptide (TPR) repeat protein
LVEALAALRRGEGPAAGAKVLLLLDQFEQFLHAHGQDGDTELVRALRQCDGGRVQALLLVRDDFWLAVTHFLAGLEVDLVQGHNTAVVDLFDPAHAHKVLAAFGHAHGRLADDPGQCSRSQKAFLDQAVAGLARDGRVVPVRLALFAEMVKGRPWEPATLKAVGGTEGVGVAFLEESFSAPSANPRYRLHQKAVRGVLRVLLPERGTDIRGSMRPVAELEAASSYAGRPKEFSDLLHLLDSELRLVTPTDPEGAAEEEAGGQRAAAPAVGSRYYQLTHDYLVPAVREWLTRKQKETRRGRAELRLAERTAFWSSRPENRHLPTWWEWLNIRLFTRKRDWTQPQRWMMRRATRYHAVRGLLLTLMLVLITLGSLIGLTALYLRAEQQRQLAERQEAETQAVKKFYEDHVLAAARPKNWAGGVGKDVTLKEALDHAVPEIEKAFADQPELEAAVRDTIGMTYYYLGQYEAAGPQLKQAHDIRLRVLGPDHPDTLTSQHNLAMERWKQEKYGEAIELGRQTLERRRRVLGPEHEDTLFTQLNLGLFLLEDGQYDQAEALLRPGVETCKRVLGPDHHHTLYGQSDLALVLNNKDKYEEAIALDRDTLDKRRRSLGSDHPDTLRSMGNLAYSLSYVGNLQEAEELARQALQGRRCVLGDEHEETFGSLGELADILEQRGKREEAEQLLRQLVAACRRKYGPDFAQTLGGQNKLAWVLMKQGKLDEAETLLRQTLDAQRRVRGPDNEKTLMWQGDLAGMLGEQGKLAEAETLYRQTLDAQRRVLGPDHQNVLVTQHNLAWALRRQEKLDKAEALLRQTLDAERRVLGPDIPNTLTTQNQLAGVLEEQGKLDGAETLYRQTLNARRRVLGPNNPDTLGSQGDLARVLGHQSKRDEAERLFREALAGYRKTVAPDNLSLASTLADFGLHLTENGRLTEAEPLLRECLAIREKKLPPGHWQIANARSLLGGCLSGQKNFAEAEPLLLSGCEGLTKGKGAPAKQVAKAFDRVIELYEKWGKPEQAEAWRKKRPAPGK